MVAEAVVAAVVIAARASVVSRVGENQRHRKTSERNCRTQFKYHLNGNRCLRQVRTAVRHPQ